MKTKIHLLAAFAFAAIHAAPAAPILGTPPAQGSASAAGHSFLPVLSADGTHLVFISHANNLVTNDDRGLWLDVFVRNLTTSNTVLVSVSSNGVGGANADANFPSVSADGRFVAFTSRASNLVPGDTNETADVFRRDLVSGQTHLVSVDVPAADPAAGRSSRLSSPLITADGEQVFFESPTTNGLDRHVNVFVRHLGMNGGTTLVSADTNGNPLIGNVELHSISTNGRYAAYLSTNTSIVSGVTNRDGDVYVRDLVGGVTHWASRDVVNWFPAPYACSFAALAADGSAVVFNATRKDTEQTGVFLFDVASGTTTRLYNQRTTNHPPRISADGDVVVFEAPLNTSTEIVLWSRASNTTVQVHQSGVNYPQFRTRLVGLSADGSTVVFLDGASPLMTNWSGVYQVFSRNMVTGEAKLISTRTNGGFSAGSHLFASVAVSADGSKVAFASTASDLADGDRNGASDIFLRDVTAGVTELVTAALLQRPAATPQAHSFLGRHGVSANGRFLATLRTDDPTVFRDTNGWRDLFVTDMWSNSIVPLSIPPHLLETNTYGNNTLVQETHPTNRVDVPVISADGQTVAAVHLLGNGYPYRLVVHRAVDGVFRPSAHLGVDDWFGGSPLVEGHGPSISGDGALIAYRRQSSQVAVHYSYLTNDSRWSTNHILLSNVENLRNPAISRDGAWIAFTGTSGVQAFMAYLGTNRLDSNYLQNVAFHLASFTTSTQAVVVYSTNPPATNTHWNTLRTPRSVPVNSLFFTDDSRFLFYELSDGSAAYRQELFTYHTNVTRSGGTYITNLYAGAETVLACTDCRNVTANADGSVVIFERTRSNPTTRDLFARNLRTGEETLVSANLNNYSSVPRPTPAAISADARYVVFTSRASNLAMGDVNDTLDLFVRDRLLGTTMLVSANAHGTPGNGPSTRPVIAADGRTVVFQSFANDLLGGDYNDRRDVFVLKLAGADSEPDGMDDDWEVAYFGNLSRNGTGDFDGDGATDGAEFLAGTDPTNGQSIFRVLTVSALGGGNTRVMWTGNSERSYRVEFKDDLSAATWTALDQPIVWNGSTASLIDATAGAAHRYYRVVRLP